MFEKFKKYLTIGCLGLLCITTNVFAASCVDNSGKDSTESTQYVLTLKAEEKTISVGESVLLEVDTYNGERTVEWSSSNNSIAIVQDGVVTGISVGTAIITAKAGSVQDTCMVFVKESVSMDANPVVELTLEKTDLYIEQSTILQAQLKKGTAVLTGVVYDYSVSNEAVVQIDSDGRITATAEGVATITVQATLENESYYKAVTINVKPDYEIAVDAKTVELDAISQWGETSYNNAQTLTASVFYRGEPTDKTVVWTSEDVNVVAVENGTVTAQKAGNTTVSATCEIEGRTYCVEVRVAVQAVDIGLLTENTIEIPVETQYSLSNIENYNTIASEIKGVYLSMKGVSYPMEMIGDNAFSIPERFSAKDIEIVIETDKIKASFLIDAYVAIENYTDLTMLYEKQSGYFKLVSNIDMTGKEWSYPQKNTFSGIFDGNGNEIKGLQLTGSHGLFYEVENTVEIIDLTLTDVSIETQESVGALIAFDKNTGTEITVENVVANVSILDGGASGGLFGSILGSVSLKNVTVYTYQPSHDATKNGAIFASLSSKLKAEQVEIYSALQYVSSNAPLSPIDGLTHISPTVFKQNGKELRLNFLSETATYDLQDNTLLTVDKAKLYCLNSTVDTVSEFTINDSYLLQMGGKNVEVVGYSGNNVLYYYIPVSEKGYLTQENFYKLPSVTSGEVFLEEDIDFANVINWQEIKNVKFTGVFDGQNHTISNFNGRMFFEFCGTAKNFDLVNATVKNEAGYGLIADLMRAGSKLENVSIVAKVGNYEKCGVLARYFTDNVNLGDVSIFAVSTRTSDSGFIAGFGLKSAYVNCTDCVFVVTNDNNSFAPCGIRSGSYFNSFEEMGVNYSKVVRGDFALYNSPLDFMNAYQENTLTETQKRVYEEKFQTVLEKEVKEVKTATDLSEMLKGEASYYYLTADIDCTNLNWSNIERNQTKYFDVILEGNEHSINGLPDYLFYNFQGRIQNVAFTNMKAGSSICKIARGGSLMNVFLHGEVVRDADGGLYAQEIKAYKGSGLYNVLFDNVTIVTTNTPQTQYKQGFIAGYATTKNTIDCVNSVFISKYLPIKARTDKNEKGEFLYVSNLGDNYTEFLKGSFVRYTSANQLDKEYQGAMTSLNKKYYDLTKVLEDETESNPGEDVEWSEQY